MTMILRSLVASTVVAGMIAAGSASAQVLLCPEAPPADTPAADIPAESERLLKRLTIALDLHGHRGISEQGIIEAHAGTPSALLAKLSNVTNQCRQASGDLEGFYASLPGLRKAFLKATDIAGSVDVVHDRHDQQEIKAAASELSIAEQVEQSIDLSVRELWRKLWFRPAQGDSQQGDRWAVIVASPSDADSGWDELGRHQRRWKDAYFQLHIPYYDSNPYHAIVVGRRLPRDQAEQLRDYAIEIGMAEDAYLWELPLAEEREEAPTLADVSADDASDQQEKTGLDLSILDR